MSEASLHQAQLVSPGDFRGIVDLVHRHLREEILTGALPAGAPLLQRQLADRLGVSREPVRHALRLLESDGLVEPRPRRSPIVATVSTKMIAITPGRSTPRSAMRSQPATPTTQATSPATTC